MPVATRLPQVRWSRRVPVMQDVVLVRDLVVRFPQLRPAYQQHLRANFGQLLPHVLFWDVTQLVVASYLSGDPDEVDWRGVLEFLAERYAGTDDDDVGAM